MNYCTQDLINRDYYSFNLDLDKIELNDNNIQSLLNIIHRNKDIAPGEILINKFRDITILDIFLLRKNYQLKDRNLFISVIKKHKLISTIFCFGDLIQHYDYLNMYYDILKDNFELNSDILFKSLEILKDRNKSLEEDIDLYYYKDKLTSSLLKSPVKYVIDKVIKLIGNKLFVIPDWVISSFDDIKDVSILIKKKLENIGDNNNDKLFLTRIYGPLNREKRMLEGKNWFTNYCNECGRNIKMKCHALRFPLSENEEEWLGCYCSFKCLKIINNNYNNPNLDNIIEEIKNIKIEYTEGIL